MSLSDDFSFMWWKNGYRYDQTHLCLLTSRYGAEFCTAVPRIEKLAVFSADKTDVVNNPNAVLDDAFGITLELLAKREDREYVPKVKLGQTSRLIEQGHFIQRFDIENIEMTDAGDSLSECFHLECTAHYDRLLLSFTGETEEAQVGFRLGMSGSIRTEQDGNLLWLIDEQKNMILCFSEVASCEKTESFYYIWARKDSLLMEMIAGADPYSRVLHPDQVSIHWKKNTSVAADQSISYEKEHGWFRVPVLDDGRTMISKEERDQVDIIGISLENQATVAQHIPLMLDIQPNTPIVGVCICAFYDDGSNRRFALPFQISKNWHQDPAGRQLLYQGPWAYAHTEIELQPGEKQDLKLEIIRASYHGAFSASHSQLCLIGWGENQLWDQAALGNFGESICYDPDICLGRSMIDDIRPLCVAQTAAEQWNWTNNLGGGDFLHVIRNGKKRNLTAVTAEYVSYGPCYTEVIYRGCVENSIDAEITVSLMRSDDIVRAVHRFTYQVRQDYAFDRLALYQLGADHYNDNFDRFVTLGNDDGRVLELEIDFDGSTEQYLLEGLEIPKSAWGCLTGSGLMPSEKGASGNRALVVRKYQATLDNKTYYNPCFSIYATNDQIQNASIELSLPAGKRSVKKGDQITCELELLILPRTKEEYYGPSHYLQETEASLFDTWHMVHRQCLGNQYRVVCTIGTYHSSHFYPVEIQTDQQDKIYAEFTIAGGLSYLPVLFTGIRENRSFCLQEKKEDTWVISSDSMAQQVLQKDGLYQVYVNIYRDGKAPVSYRLVADN